MRSRCLVCNRRRTTNAFRMRGAQIRSTCRECENTQNRTRNLELKRKILSFLRIHPCVDCGENNPVVLEFDHVSGYKRKTISELVKKAYSWEVIQMEMEKCEVRCANCHRIRTARERNYWIYNEEQE